MLGDFYRGRLSFNDIKNLPAGEFKIYWTEALNQLKSKEGQESKASEKLEDVLTDSGIM